MARVSQRVCCVEPNILNPRQLYYLQTELAKMAGDIKAFYLSDLIKDFKDAGLDNIQFKRINYIYPVKNKSVLNLMINGEPILQKVPIVNLFSASLVVCGQRGSDY